MMPGFISARRRTVAADLLSAREDGLQRGPYALCPRGTSGERGSLRATFRFWACLGTTNRRLLPLLLRNEGGEGRGALPFSLGLGMGKGSINSFSQVALMVIRAMEGLRSPEHLSMGTHAHRIASHPALQFLQYLFQRTLAPEQIEHPLLQRVVADRPIDLRRILAAGILRAQFFLRLLAQQTFH